MAKKAGGPPRAYKAFTKRYPLIGQAWDSVREQEEKGPLDEGTRRLLKLAVAIGAGREGAVHSAVRKAVAAGVSRAGTLGFPATVAADTWVQEVLGAP
jgi:alkylhydroperoxidase/carboxymuconolactone decarboxylase family protein YurZ